MEAEQSGGALWRGYAGRTECGRITYSRERGDFGGWGGGGGGGFLRDFRGRLFLEGGAGERGLGAAEWREREIPRRAGEERNGPWGCRTLACPEVSAGVESPDAHDGVRGARASAGARRRGFFPWSENRAAAKRVG